jgi:GNAT superfamily N-acetyltransferase
MSSENSIDPIASLRDRQPPGSTVLIAVRSPPVDGHSIAPAREADLGELLGLMRAYCDFYEVTPGDDELLAISRALIADPAHEGVQFVARDSAGQAVGFATLYWTWSTTTACRIGVMNDLFVAPGARGQGVAERLIEACRTQSARHGARRLTWQTAPDNVRAQTVYERVGATREQWVDYWLSC